MVYRPDRRLFQRRHKEHIHAIKYNKDTSSYAQHLLNKGHSYGNIQNTVLITQVTQNGKNMNRLEKLHIHCTHQQNEQMNEVVFDLQNSMFDTIYRVVLTFLDQFMALHFMETDAPQAARHIRILPMNQYA
jgi:hypothetical protein